MSPSASPPQRTVARPVSNLGNTCYMNAVLQALAHAPELCLAMDCEPHSLHCPRKAGLSRRRRPISSSSGTRKSRRTGRSKSPETSGGSGAAAGSGETTESNGEEEFCLLCELEQHFRTVFDTTTTTSSAPVAPNAFCHGFINHVAPWFKLGVQEDSHEFLRLLIDAMQKACERARKDTANVIDNDNPPPPQQEQQQLQLQQREEEYPFYLFRGTVESNVTCSSCGASSATRDPIEDVGLEVAPQSNGSQQQQQQPSSSRNSPIPLLADVQTAFQRLTKAEELDAGYKCETCGKVGRATKETRLASIPPILTLHLKRFRYGADTRAVSLRSRSEVSQLLGGNGVGGGKSGAAKIEGHIKFELLFDLKPYLTESLQAKHDNMFCRLFAVVVHAGKNSHSGHYYAFVRNLSKNEWWKMDDSRVTAATVKDVMSAEAYMLFYRVVQHPVAIRLEEMNKKLTEVAVETTTSPPPQQQQQQKQKHSDKMESEVTAPTDPHETKDKIMATSTTTTTTTTTTTSRRKRPALRFENGEDWLKHIFKKSSVPPHLLALIRKAQDMIADEVQLSPEYFKTIQEEAAKQAPLSSTTMTDRDVVGGTDTYRNKLSELFYALAQQLDGSSGGGGGGSSSGNSNSAAFWKQQQQGTNSSTTTSTTATSTTTSGSSPSRVAVVEPEEADVL